MGLSNYIPTSSIARPGVCTSTTRPASPYEGQTIYETDTDLLRYWNGSAWKITAGLMPTCIIKTSTAQTGIAPNTWTKLTFASHTTDVNNGGFTISSGGITIPTGLGGVYHVFGQCQWDSDATGVRVIGLATTSALSTTIVSGQTAYASGSDRTAFSGIAVLTAGSEYCISGLQTTAANRSLQTSFLTQTFALTMLSQN